MSVAFHPVRGDAQSQAQFTASETIELTGEAYTQLDAGKLRSDAGSLVVWVKPRWDDDSSSHAILSMQWSNGGYLAISQGWWEPGGARRLHFVFNNREAAFCIVPGEFDLQLFARDEWTMLAATWAAGAPGHVRLFVDGEPICERRTRIASSMRPDGPLFVGSDRGASDRRGRHGDVVVHGVEAYQRELTDKEVRLLYTRSGGDLRRKWMQPLIQEDNAATPDEVRVLFDEDAHWADSPLDATELVRRTKRAGFNSLIVCVWNGADALFDTELAEVSTRFRNAQRANHDPLAHLLREARSAGLKTHLWFYVAKRTSDRFPRSYFDGAPDGAFDLRSTAFSRFISSLIADAVVRYRPDGINLDYIRTMGVCTAPQCAVEYRRRFKRDLAADWQAQANGRRVAQLVEWQREAVSAVLAQISTAIRAKNVETEISVDTIALDHSRDHQGVDVESWIARGLIDRLYHMAYETPLDVARMASVWRTIPRGRFGVVVRNYADGSDGVIATPGVVLADTVRLIRSQWNGAAIGVYHYPRMTSEQSLSLSAAFDSGTSR